MQRHRLICCHIFHSRGHGTESRPFCPDTVMGSETGIRYPKMGLPMLIIIAFPCLQEPGKHQARQGKVMTRRMRGIRPQKLSRRVFTVWKGARRRRRCLSAFTQSYLYHVRFEATAGCAASGTEWSECFLHSIATAVPPTLMPFGSGRVSTSTHSPQ